jgi:hypothetical protein
MSPWYFDISRDKRQAIIVDEDQDTILELSAVGGHCDLEKIAREICKQHNTSEDTQA